MSDPDPDPEAMAQRLRAVERAVTDSERPPTEVAAAAEATDRLEALEDRLDAVEDRLAELEAATQALRGYVGNVRSVNEDVERRADAALSMASALQSGADETSRRVDDGTRRDRETRSDRETWRGIDAPGGTPTAPPDASGDEPTAPVDAHGDGSTDARETATTEADPRPGEEATPRSGDEATLPPDGWGDTSGPWEPAAPDAASTQGASRDAPGSNEGADRNVDRPGRGRDGDGSPLARGSDRGEGDADRSRDDGDANRTWGETAWPADGDRADAGDGGEWPPDGMDLDRAQPWSVPDPGDEDWDHAEERSLLDRVREAL